MGTLHDRIDDTLDEAPGAPLDPRSPTEPPASGLSEHAPVVHFTRPERRGTFHTMDRDDLTEKDTDHAELSDFSAAPRAYLIVREGERSEVVEVPPGGELVIGRVEGADLVIDDRRVSRKHARVRWDAGALLIEDLGSRNGTAINGDVLKGGVRSARGGDCVRLAGREISVALVASPETPASPPSSTALSAEALEGIVVADPSMARMFGFARRVAATTTTVLILGETGVGKEIVAQQIHGWSDRSARRFIRVNCAALPESLVESELFGHERGAFTGADKRKIGFAEAAHQGTLFLDEIGELPLAVQAKLLAMLENRAVVRVGSTVETAVDVRVIAATHRSLTQEVAEGRFREDLYYRIGVAVIRVPPLRERPSEISLLAELFAKRFGPRLNWSSPVISPDASAALVAHGWPGNIRELRNAMEHAMLLTEDGVIRREHLPETVTGGQRPSGAHARAPQKSAKGVRAAIAEVERASIQEALRAQGGNRTKAALELGISLRSLLYKIQKYGLGKA
jgi:DNA-binding NtrC family response regulator